VSYTLLNHRLARTPYLVIPKLALSAMPEDWQDRFESMMVEMEEAGLRTPAYHVFRDDGEGKRYTRARAVNEITGFVRLTGGDYDPWANYRYGDAFELSREEVK